MEKARLHLRISTSDRIAAKDARRYEVQHLQTAVGMVLSHVGIAIVPKMAGNMPGVAGLAAVPLRNPSIHRSLGVITRRDRPLSRTAQALLHMVRQHFVSLLR